MQLKLLLLATTLTALSSAIDTHTWEYAEYQFQNIVGACDTLTRKIRNNDDNPQALRHAIPPGEEHILKMKIDAIQALGLDGLQGENPYHYYNDTQEELCFKLWSVALTNKFTLDTIIDVKKGLAPFFNFGSFRDLLADDYSKTNTFFRGAILFVPTCRWKATLEQDIRDLQGAFEKAIAIYRP